jgi:hypothetical protein
VQLARKKRVLNTVINGTGILALVLVVAVLFFRNNPFLIRVTNIFSGRDLSGKGRTQDAFLLAQRILDDTDKYWGAGLGQVKLAGADIIRDYYKYAPTYPVTIPNAAAETLAVFGWTGFLFRIFFELSLFFITRVWLNYYRLALFAFIFIYQFTGSFITNLAEYVIWILAFTNVFPQYDIQLKNKGDQTRFLTGNSFS